MSQPIFLEESRIYKMVVFMYERQGRDHASVGMRKPNGEYERPIPGTRLFRTQPGNIVLGSYFKTYNAFTIILFLKKIGFKKRIYVASLVSVEELHDRWKSYSRYNIMSLITYIRKY